MASPNTSGLKPSQPGEIRNPAGHNQYTYRRKFLTSMADLAQGKTGRQTTPYSGPRVCFVCRLAGCDVMASEVGPMHASCIDVVRESPRADLFARLLWSQALAGHEWACKLLAQHLAPAQLLVKLGLEEPGAAADSEGETTASRFDALPPDTRAVVHGALSAVIQGKPSLAGERHPIDVLPSSSTHASDLEAGGPDDTRELRPGWSDED